MINNVSINLKTDEVIIKIEDNATQDDIILELTKKLMELKKMYQEEKTPIRVTGKILKNKGMVFGAAFDNQMKLGHISIEDNNELYKVKGTKYIQSSIGTTFVKVKDCLLYTSDAADE